MGRVKERFVWCPERRELVAVAVDSRQAPRGTLLMTDLPDYVSPVTGKVVSGRKQRREDLKRTGSRPYEGREQEDKVAAKYRAEQQQKFEARIENTAREVFHQLPPSKRRYLEEGS